LAILSSFSGEDSRREGLYQYIIGSLPGFALLAILAAILIPLIARLMGR
jgi:hypothetical protein